MSVSAVRGLPFVGYVSLSSGTLSASVPIVVARNGAGSYSLSAGERVAITSIVASTNDATIRLVQVTDGAASALVLASFYVVASAPPVAIPIAPDLLRGFSGVAPVVSVAAVTAAKTVELTFTGVVQRTAN